MNDEKTFASIARATRTHTCRHTLSAQSTRGAAKMSCGTRPRLSFGEDCVVFYAVDASIRRLFCCARLSPTERHAFKLGYRKVSILGKIFGSDFDHIRTSLALGRLVYVWGGCAKEGRTPVRFIFHFLVFLVAFASFGRAGGDWAWPSFDPRKDL